MTATDATPFTYHAPEHGGYLAVFPALPDLIAFGETPAAALAALRAEAHQAIDALLDSATERLDVPMETAHANRRPRLDGPAR